MSPVTSIRTNRPTFNRASAGLASLFAAAGVLLLPPAVQAAEPGGDAQAQARSLLLAPTSFEAQHESREAAHAASTHAPDVQEQASSILLSKTTFDTRDTRAAALRSRSSAVPTAISPRVRQADAQEGARALLLGRGS
jgi:hypothetical protein